MSSVAVSTMQQPAAGTSVLHFIACTAGFLRYLQALCMLHNPGYNSSCVHAGDYNRDGCRHSRFLEGESKSCLHHGG